jgi:glycosyltransferase 2 family protein
MAKVFAWLLAIAVAIGVLDLLGVNVRGWFQHLWDALSGIGIGYLLAGWTLQTFQTTLTALAWFSILRAAYPDPPVRFRMILAAYATGVALNGFLPANIGTIVMLLMFTAIIVRANFAGVLGGMVVQKIFFTVAGMLVYIYLFLSVDGSLNISLPAVSDNPGLVVGIVLGALALLAILGRLFWPRVKAWVAKAAEGGAILRTPRRYVSGVLLPEVGSYAAKLGVIAVFLAGYGIPVTFHTVMSVVGGNSIANTVSVTPGGVGVNQATNVAALHGVADSAQATAYSLGQQLAVTAWNIAFALVLVVWAFGWTGGKLLVEQSYADARVKVDEQKAQRAEKKAAKRAARDH